MAGSINKVILVGNLGSDPEVRQFNNGGSVCSFSVATGESWKDKNTGERREKTEWHRVSIFSEGLVKVASQYLKKGSKVYLEGQLETRKWQDKEGHDRYTTEVVLKGWNSNLTMLDSRNSGDSAGGGSYGNQISGGSGVSGNMNGGGMQEGGGAPSYELDDEIPF
ncbi:MAG: single-stranded DNA-binding protein [Parvularculaceae bacterium]